MAVEETAVYLHLMGHSEVYIANGLELSVAP